MSNTIINLRGGEFGLPELVWPGDDLTPLIERVAELWAERCDSPSGSRGARAWMCEIDSTRAAAAWRFAEVNGLTHGKGFSPWRLIGKQGKGLVPPWAGEAFRHPNYLTLGGQPAGIVGHPYARLESLDLASVPSTLVIDKLPVSWYSSDTSALVFRRSLPSITANAPAQLRRLRQSQLTEREK